MNLVGRMFAVVMVIIAWTAVWAEKHVPNVCRECNGRIEEAGRKFSVVVMKGIEASAFDDIGCALVWRNSECAMRQVAFDENALVHDHDSGKTVSIEKAAYVVDAGIDTPKGYGITAFMTKEAAERFVISKGKGRVLTYSELLNLKLK